MDNPTKDAVPVLESVDEYLAVGQEYDCSDVHLATASPPSWRRFGILQAIWENAELLTAEDTERLVAKFLTEEQKARLDKIDDVDFARSLDHTGHGADG